MAWNCTDTNNAESQWNLVGSSINEAVSDTVASANIDVAVSASTTVHYAIVVELEASGNTAGWQIATTRARRSGSGTPDISGVSVKDGSGAISISAAPSGNNLRVSVTPSLGANVRMNIYVYETLTLPSVEFS